MDGAGQAGDSRNYAGDYPNNGSRSKKRELSDSSMSLSDHRKKLAREFLDTHSQDAADGEFNGMHTIVSAATPTSSESRLTLLEIYDYLFSDLLMHVYSSSTTNTSHVYYSSSACAKPEISSFLCSVPHWAVSKDCCTYESPQKRCKNRLAFAFTCKVIYEETKLMLYSRPSFHISYVILVPFLRSLQYSQRDSIQSLTVTGPFMGGRRAINNTAGALAEASRLLPGLRRIAVQVPVSTGLMVGNSLDPSPRWLTWKISEVLLGLRKDGVQKILLETTSLVRAADHFIMFRAEQEEKDWLQNPNNITTTTHTKTLPNKYEVPFIAIELKKHWLF